MANPFPGMDPYLEDPSVWPGMHHLLITHSAAYLQPRLRARGYYVDIGERVWLAEPRRPIYPDAAIHRLHRTPDSESGGVAVVEADEPIRIARADIEIREPYLEIHDRSDNRLVTGIEFLSPTNKSDSTGRELYQRKHDELRQGGVHLVEIDLIRRGPHVLDVPHEVIEPFRPLHYLVNLVRRGSDEYEVYPIRLRDRLPRIRIPLKEGDEDAVLDVQEVFDRSYDIGPYPERIDYNSDPIPPLAADDAAWADQILREKGLRT